MIAIPDGFDRRLDPNGAGPIAVAYSGGGDSLMALKLAKAWADRHDRRIIALTVDHGLQTSSARWTEAARQTAHALGVGFQALAWTGEKPNTGLAAAARTARHALIAAAARDRGARVVVFGHTADDLIEAELMRSAGLRLGAPREWAPSPVWPEGRGVFLLRPLLGLRRAAIREALHAWGETWIDDPANDNPASPRARARPRAGRLAAREPRDETNPATTALARAAVIDQAGAIRLSREALREAPRTSVLRVLGAALTCAGGRAGPPRRRALERLVLRLLTSELFVATLSGTKVQAGGEVLIARDAGEFRRRRPPVLEIEPGCAEVWDGRFEIAAGSEPIGVAPLAGHMKSLPRDDMAGLKRFDPAARGGLPWIVTTGGRTSCPILASVPDAGAKSLVGERFFSACGVYSREPAT